MSDLPAESGSAGIKARSPVDFSHQLTIDCNRAADQVGPDGKPFGRRRLNRVVIPGMSDSTFDYSNPWHREVNLFFGFDCSCGVTFDCTKIEMEVWKDPFPGYCVSVAERAQCDGWLMVGEGDLFLCPKCARATPTNAKATTGESQ